MRVANDGDNALLEAIGRLHAEIDRLIDEQLAELDLLRPSQPRSDDEQAAWPDTERALAKPVEAPVPRAQAHATTPASPRERLDALARHLDDRMRERRESTAERPAGEPGANALARSAP